MVTDTGYAIEGETREYEREQLAALKQCLDRWFAQHPDVAEDDPLDHFAMHAVRRLVGAFAFNDSIGADEPDYKPRLIDRLAARADWPSMGEKEQLRPRVRANRRQPASSSPAIRPSSLTRPKGRTGCTR
jgi:hypothetical protein